MSNIVFFTIAAKNFMGYARAWVKNVRSVYGNVPIYVFIADENDGEFDAAMEDFPIIESQTIGIPDFDYMKFVYEVTEFATSIKPYCINWIFNKHPGTIALYMDSDTMLLSKFVEMENLFLEGAEVVLTPHICEPLCDGKSPDEYAFLRTGIFNLGFGAFKDLPTVRAFVGWWEEKLAQDCIWDLDQGIHVDQKWMDYAPAFLDHAKILRHPGYNLAYWNLAHRSVDKKKDQWFANGVPIRFVHISGNSLKQVDCLSPHQNRYITKEYGPFSELVSVYQKAAIECGQLDTGMWGYSYQKSRDFEKIPFYVRKAYRKVFDRKSMYKKDTAKEAWQYFCALDDRTPMRCEDSLTRLEEAYYMLRIDLHSIFNIDTVEGRIGYLNWLKIESLNLLDVPGNR